MGSTGTVVVKIGGSTLGQHDTTLEDLAELQRQGVPVVVVHGGGKAISEWQRRLQLEPRFVDGLRVTDGESLAIAVAVLSGLVNKELVAGLAALGARAIGLSGADGALIEASIKDPRLGYVGSIGRINRHLLDALLDAGYLPLVSPIAIGPGGQLLNVNADTVAGEMACALQARALIFLTDVPGILDEGGIALGRQHAREMQALLTRGVVSGGMIPKVKACVRALEAVQEAHIIDGHTPHALLECLRGHVRGTTIVADTTVVH